MLARTQTFELGAGLWDLTPDVVLVARPDGVIIDANQVARVLIGRNEVEPVTDLNVADLHSRPGGELILDVAIPFALANGSWAGESHLLGTDTELIPVSMSVVARDVGLPGERLYLIGRLLSERAKLEKAREEFVATVSHELRTPLTSIRGALSMLVGGVMGPYSDEVAEMIDLALQNAVALQRIVDDILDFEAVKSGQMSMTLALRSLDPVLESVVAALGPLAQLSEVDLRANIEPGLPLLRIDPDRMGQLFTNLVGNAIKFSAPGCKVTIEAFTNAPGTVIVNVVDTGPGIAPEDLDRVFDPFVQGDGSATRRVGGSGLGLAIVRSIAAAHGAEVSLESVLGEGSCFTVAFPCSSSIVADCR